MPVLMWFAPAESRSTDNTAPDAQATIAKIDTASSADAAFKLFACFVPKERFRFITATYAFGTAAHRDPAPPSGDFGETLHIPYADARGFHSSLILRGPRSTDRFEGPQYEILMHLGRSLQKRFGELAMISAG